MKAIGIHSLGVHYLMSLALSPCRCPLCLLPLLSPSAPAVSSKDAKLRYSAVIATLGSLNPSQTIRSLFLSYLLLMYNKFRIFI